jgi:MoaA/NifB/PqqE/SkfB family radical SAM enzyme
MIKTLSMCPVCYKKVEARIGFTGGQAIMFKTCDDHGDFTALVENDISFFSRFYHIGTLGRNNNIIIHIEDKCNMSCEWCYYGGKEGEHDLSYYTNLLHAYKSQGFQLLLSGGEPTIRSDYFKFLSDAKQTGWHCGTITNMINLADESFFNEALKHNFSTNLFDYALSFQHPKNYNSEILEKKMIVARRLKKMGIKVQCIAFSIQSLDELKFIKNFYDEFKDIAFMWRIRTMFLNWENKQESNDRLYLSDLSREFLSIFADCAPVISNDVEQSNFYCMYMQMDGGRHVSLSSSPTVDNIDYHVCSRPVFMLARDLRCYPVPIAQIVNEGFNNGWYAGHRLYNEGGISCGSL